MYRYLFPQILHSIVQMVDRCRRAMVALKEQCRRDHLTFTTKTSNGGQALRTSPGSDANLRLADDLHLLQVRQLAGELSVRFILIYLPLSYPRDVT